MITLIPAIDLRNNQVVHAYGGDRSNYLPLATPLFPSSDPLDVISRLHNRYGYKTFYIADLGAIAETAKNTKTIHAIIDKFPDFTYWLDTGIKNYSEYKKAKKNFPCIPIIGSETLTEPYLVPGLHEEGERYILSLDFKNQMLLGNKKILQQSQYWPEIVIALSLNAVGGNGPDFDVLDKVCQYNHHSRIVLGGGIRNINDLSQIRNSEINMILIATALYNNQLHVPKRKPE